jgi:hypothetical protein
MSLAQPETYGGYETTAMFAFEETFGTQLTDPSYQLFGLNTQVSTKSFDNNLEDDYEPNARVSDGKTAMQFAGDISVEFTATNPQWVPAAVDEGTTSGTSAPYTHTYSGPVTRPMEIVHGIEPDSQETLVSGVVFTNATVTGNETGRVTVTLDGSYAKEEEIDNFTAQPSAELEPLTFKHGSVTYNGTNFEILQEWEFEIENNSELVFEQGDRFARTYHYTGPRETTFTTTQLRVTSSVKELAYGSSGSSSPQQDVEDSHTIELVLDNGETNASKQTETWTFDGCSPSDFDRSGIANQEESLTDEVNWNVDGVELVAENSLESWAPNVTP